MLSDEIISLMKKSIRPKNKEEWVNLDVNCFLYAINCDLPTKSVLYVDNELKKHCAWNVGEVSDNFKKDNPKEKIKYAFLEDCKRLDINVKKVSEDYEPLLKDEWLVALYCTDPFYYLDGKQIDFHFIKKNFNDKTWTHKFPSCNIISVDDENKPITLPSNFICHASLPNCLLKYKYIDTYRLIRKKDLVKKLD